MIEESRYSKFNLLFELFYENSLTKDRKPIKDKYP
jgi:hypothetical protein